MNFEFFIALRYLSQPSRHKAVFIIGLISLVGVSLGVIALIVALSIMNGFERDLKRALIGANAHLTLTSYNNQLIDFKDDTVIEKIKQSIQPEVILPFVLEQGLITGNEPRGALVRGIDARKEAEAGQIFELISTKIISGNKTNLQEQEAKEILKNLPLQERLIYNDELQIIKQNLSGIILGSSLASKLRIRLNDTVNLISSESRISPLGQLPKIKKFIVVGFFHSGISGYDEVLAFIDINESFKIFSAKNLTKGYSIFLKNIDTIQKSQIKLSQVFPFPHIVTSWIDNNQNLFAVIQLEKLGLATILMLIVLIASFNIISSLTILVIEKSKDVAILKSLGATDKSILKVFIIQGSIVGVIGTITGLVIGLGICWLIANYDIVKIPEGVYVSNNIPIYVDYIQVAIIGLVSFFICFITTIFPANRASKSNPVDILKYE